MSDDAMTYLMGDNVPSATFPEIGSTIKGEVLAMEKTQQRDFGTKAPLHWEDGSPMWQLVFTLATDERSPDVEDDDGTRKVYAKAQMLQAVRDAVRKTGHKGSVVGGKLAVKYDHDGEPSRRGYNPPKQYVARFEPPIQTDDLDDTEPF